MNEAETDSLKIHAYDGYLCYQKLISVLTHYDCVTENKNNRIPYQGNKNMK